MTATRKHYAGTIEQQRIERLKDIELECNALLTQNLDNEDKSKVEKTRNSAIALRLELELNEESKIGRI